MVMYTALYMYGNRIEIDLRYVNIGKITMQLSFTQEQTGTLGPIHK